MCDKESTSDLKSKGKQFRQNDYSDNPLVLPKSVAEKQRLQIDKLMRHPVSIDWNLSLTRSLVLDPLTSFHGIMLFSLNWEKIMMPYYHILTYALIIFKYENIN